MTDENGKSWFALNVPLKTRIAFGLGAGGVLLAGAALAFSSWRTWPWLEQHALVVAGSFMAVGLLGMTVGGLWLMERAPKGGSAYAPFIFALGILMNGVGGTGVVGVAGLIHSQQLPRTEEVAAQTSTTPEAGEAEEARVKAIALAEQRRARFVLLAGVMAFIGSLFYIALALHRKSKDTDEAFDAGALVSGAALRSGEAMLFVLCFVLLTQVESSGELDGWLPVTGLLLGMFVKSGERFVFNLAQRVFEYAQTLVPGGRSDPKAKGKDGDADAPELEERSSRTPRTNGSKPPPALPEPESRTSPS